MEKLARDLRVETLQTWGMTEALGGSSVLMAPFAVPRSVDGCINDCMTSGRATWGVDYRLVDDAGQERPQDGASVGHFRIKAPWVSSAFFKNEGGSALDAPQMLAFMRGKGVDGWLPDDVVFVDQMLMTGTGKVHKLTLRQQFSTYLLPGAGLSG